MANYNKVILAGNLTRDPELRTTTGGTSVAKFGLAVNRKFKDQETTCFVDCVAFGKQAELIDQYLGRGAPPPELSEAMREVLGEGHRVALADGSTLDLWLRESWPGDGQMEGVFGIEYGAVTASGLVGALRLETAWIDYRETRLDPGVPGR